MAVALVLGAAAARRRAAHGECTGVGACARAGDHHADDWRESGCVSSLNVGASSPVCVLMSRFCCVGGHFLTLRLKTLINAAANAVELTRATKTRKGTSTATLPRRTSRESCMRCNQSRCLRTLGYLLSYTTCTKWKRMTDTSFFLSPSCQARHFSSPLLAKQRERGGIGERGKIHAAMLITMPAARVYYFLVFDHSSTSLTVLLTHDGFRPHHTLEIDLFLRE